MTSFREVGRPTQLSDYSIISNSLFSSFKRDSMPDTVMPVLEMLLCSLSVEPSSASGRQQFVIDKHSNFQLRDEVRSSQPPNSHHGRLRPFAD